MIIHSTPSAKNIDFEFGVDYFEELLDENPAVSDIKDYASSNWWGDIDDFITYLKNLDTGEYLYSPEEVEENYEEEDEE